MLALVPDGEGEHAAQIINARRAVLFVSVNNRLRIGMSLKGVPAPFKLALQLSVIVNLAVEDDCHRAVFARHRLMTARQINDRKMAKGSGGLCNDGAPGGALCRNR